MKYLGKRFAAWNHFWNNDATGAHMTVAFLLFALATPIVGFASLIIIPEMEQN